MDIILPELSPAMTAGTLAQWHKQIGDWVAVGELLADIETEKTVMELESPAAGRLEVILVPAGEAVDVGAVIARLSVSPVAVESTGSEVSSQLTDTTADSPLPVQTSAPKTAGAPVSPRARRLAKESAIDPAALTGSGPQGRIVERDVLAALAASDLPDTAGEAAVESARGPAALSAARRETAARLVQSKQSIPHFYLSIDCRLGRLQEIRAEFNAGAAGLRLSVNDFVMRAVALALKEAPALNATWEPNEIRSFQAVHVAMAVATPHGLLAPVVRDADCKTLQELAHELRRLVDLARAGQLSPRDYAHGSFTVSNLGMHGIREFAAIINPPQSGILAVGEAERRPVVREEEIVIEELMTVTLSADHRVVDGAEAASFLTVFKRYLEAPRSMLD